MNDFTWRAHPALRLALAFVAGILTTEAMRSHAVERVLALAENAMPALAVPAPAISALVMLAAAATWLATVLWRARSRPASTPGTEGALALLVVVAASGALCASVRPADGPAPAGLSIARAECIGTIDGDPRMRRGTIELVVACDSIILRNDVARVGARVLVAIDDSTPGFASALRDGDRLSVRGTLRAPREPVMPMLFDERSYLRTRSVSMVLDVDDASQAHRVATGPALSLDRVVAWVRRRMGDYARDHVRGREAEVVEALLSGDRDGIDRATRDAFAATGTLHVLAVSGMHVAVIALGLSVVTSWLPSRRWQFVVFAVVLGAYTLVTGAGPSIVRAWCMAVCFMLARLSGRRARGLNVLGVAALILLLMHPDDLFDIGFQLSFAAVAGIILFNRRLVAACLDRWPSLRDRPWAEWPLRSLVVTLAAQALSMPLLLMHFGSTPALGLLLNLPVVPLTSLAMSAAAVGLLMSAMPPLAASLGATAYVATSLAIALVEWGATLPYASLVLTPLPASLAIGAIGGLVWASLAERVRAIALRTVLVAIAIAAGAIVATWLDPLAQRGRLRAYLVPSSGGVIVAAIEGRTLVAVAASDSPATRRRLEALSRIAGTDSTRIVAADSLDALRFPARVPIVIDRSRAPAREAHLDGTSVLVAGMRARYARMQVFEFNGRWYPITWH